MAQSVLSFLWPGWTALYMFYTTVSLLKFFVFSNRRSTVLLVKPIKTQYLPSQFSPPLLFANVEGDQGAICL